MKTAFPLICSLLSANILFAQPLADRLNKAVKALEAETQMKSAILGFYVTDKSGTKVFAENSNFGLAAASTQKVITSVAALELL